LNAAMNAWARRAVSGSSFYWPFGSCASAGVLPTATKLPTARLAARPSARINNLRVFMIFLPVGQPSLLVEFDNRGLGVGSQLRRSGTEGV
jgi:hypothetical protein